MTTGPAPVAEGELVAGKYRIGRILGEGGMGVVVAAVHEQLEQRVALKFLREEATRVPEVVARFTREARAAARIQSMHVTRVLDVGELPTRAPFMVMEYLQGEDLEKTLARRGPLPPGEAVDYLLQGCEAVAEAHAMGIIHRDLKPANLFLADHPGGRPIVKVLDFGISKLQETTSNPGLTQASSMFGSPPYMSPEQVRSTRSADVRSDVWSLGAVLYELVTQRRPFPDETAGALFVAILQDDPPPPSAHRAGIPAPLEAAIMRCLQKDPALRFQDVAMLASAIGPFGPPSSADSVARIAHVLGARGPAFSAVPPADAAPPAAPVVPTQLYPSARGPTATMPQIAIAVEPNLATRVGRTKVFTPAEPQPATAETPGTAAVPSSPSVATGSAARRTLSVAALVGGAAVIAGVAAYALASRSTPPPRPLPVSPAVTAEPPAREAPAVVPPAPKTPPSATETAPPPEPPAARAREKKATATPKRAQQPTERAAPQRTGGASLSAGCAKLLERQSLGEALTSEEKAVYARECNRR